LNTLAVGWVVKQWRTEAARDRAERDARRARRAADRATAGVAAQLEALEALERLGVELRASVARRRAVEHPLEVLPSPGVPATADGGRPAARRRAERASLRAGGLGELFRATEARAVGSPPSAA
jgi:hypothetical protein